LDARPLAISGRSVPPGGHRTATANAKKGRPGYRQAMNQHEAKPARTGYLTVIPGLDLKEESSGWRWKLNEWYRKPSNSSRTLAWN
jgi:hypothetical protein